MTGAVAWSGRRGTVLLGPTENRVARWLLRETRHGLIVVRTVDLARTLGLERSEAYRITARLRTLGLFGIENDRSGARGGRRIWRTSLERDAGALDAARHREAWARITAWARARAARVRARLDFIRSAGDLHRERTYADRGVGTVAAATAPGRGNVPAASGSFLERLAAGGLAPRLVAEFSR